MDIDDVAPKVSKMTGIHVGGVRFVAESLSFAILSNPSLTNLSPDLFAENFATYAGVAFGGMAGGVVDFWGFKNTLDIGRVVFALVDVGYFRKADTDTLVAFHNIYDFKERFNPKPHVDSIQI